MGNCNFKQPDQEDTTTAISINNFDLRFVIGRGGFGKVWRVESKKTKQIYALKEMCKAKVISKRSVNSVMNERQLLASLRHSFLINMVNAFQDRQNLYLVMDLLTGGDLRFHISRHRKFSEEQTKFFSACIIVGLEYLHQNGILHRDIKPENLVFDSKGYLRITDLGIARIWKPENSSDTSGTPGYMAPEVMCRHNHGVAVDYYALGIIVFECMMGRRPYVGKTRQEIRDQILAKQVQIKKADVPEGWSLEAADFANRLIQRKPANRLGLNGPEEVKNHVWFKDFPWQKLVQKEILSPYIPSQKEENYHVQDANRKDSNEDLNGQNAILLRRDSIQSLFQGYNFDSTHNPQPILMINSANVSNRFNQSSIATPDIPSSAHSRHSSQANSAQQIPAQGSQNPQLLQQQLSSKFLVSGGNNTNNNINGFTQNQSYQNQLEATSSNSYQQQQLIHNNQPINANSLRQSFA